MICVVSLVLSAYASAQLKTWDQKHAIDQIEVTMVYFVPSDETPLVDWKARLEYYANRIEQFHHREFSGQSILKTVIRAEPFVSTQSTEQLRKGDANAIFFKTMREVDQKLQFGTGERRAFPILLVLSEINWRPLDDFYRVRPAENGSWAFEGNYNGGRHFPGAESGGARATYLADRGVGWGLVSGDGWRVPYSGTDCVVYHEGVGHTIGLPHNEPGDGAVMSLGQYYGWISQSWVDSRQKKRLGWIARDAANETADSLFTRFTALPEPTVPKPGEEVRLKLTLPADSKVEKCRVRIQTDIDAAWYEIVQPTEGLVANELKLGSFDRATPVSYRVEVELADGQREELWGYFQVRESDASFPTPPWTSQKAHQSKLEVESKLNRQPATNASVDLLKGCDVSKQSVAGRWELENRVLTSPKEYGARIEFPGAVPTEYEMIVVVQPLDEPNGLILGQRMGDQRFLTLLNFRTGENSYASAIENVDGKNFAENDTTIDRQLFAKDQVSQIVVRVETGSVTVTCDGQRVLRWEGEPNQLSLSDYWQTPDRRALFLGAYDCRFRILRATVTPLR